MRWVTGSEVGEEIQLQSVIGIDVSKGSSVGQAFLARSKPFGKSFSFEHTKTGFQELVARLQEVERESGQRPWVIFEATGHYHICLTDFLQEQEYVTVVVNPLTAQRAKKSSLRKVKTDAQDAYHLGELFYKEEFEPHKQKSEQMFNLRSLTRHHEAMTSMYVEVGLRFRSVLDQVFPLYAGTFSNLFSKTALELLKEFPTPHEVIQAGEAQITEVIMSLNIRSKSAEWAKEKAKKMMAAAQNSAHVTVYQSHLLMLSDMIELLFRYQEHLAHLESEIDALARNIREYDLLRSIPGIGDKLAATILSEVGDIDQFEHAKNWWPMPGSTQVCLHQGSSKHPQTR